MSAAWPTRNASATSTVDGQPSAAAIDDHRAINHLMNRLP
jgi:hypothetical protein